MEIWVGWPLERLLYLFLGAAFLLVWIQVTLYHWAGGFRSKFMWGPVIYTPILVITALIMVFSRNDTVRTIFVATWVLGVVEGLFGTYKHLGGVKEMVGGLTLRNFMAGPPVVLALVYTAVAAFGVIVYYWPRISGIST